MRVSKSASVAVTVLVAALHVCRSGEHSAVTCTSGRLRGVLKVKVTELPVVSPVSVVRVPSRALGLSCQAYSAMF